MLSKSNVKYIQSLSQKKLRDEESAFVAEGPKIINELLMAPNVQLRQLYATEEWLGLQSSSVHGRLNGFVTTVTTRELDRISSLATPHQVVGIFNKPVFDGPLQLKNTVTLMLDTIQDPGNMGTIIRCADWFGIRQLVCSINCADIFNSKVVQSTMGSIARIRCVYEDLADFLGQHAGNDIYAAALEGIPLETIGKISEGILLIGNESKGIQAELLSIATQKVTIARKGDAQSLNAAVATGIMLFHLT